MISPRSLNPIQVNVMAIRAVEPVRDFSRRSIGAAVLIAGALTVSCGGEEQTRPPPEVTIAQPETRPVRPYVDFTGTTRAVESVEIRARVGGVLEQQLFEPSQIVEGGDVLFVI